MRHEQVSPRTSPRVETLRKQSTPPVSRIRPRTVSEDRTKVYRVGFSCEHRGRYFRSSKRRIRWSFVINSEDHEVVLLWSLKSGKTRVFWNRRDISNLFHTDGRSGTVELSWETRSQEKLHLLAHSESIPGSAQYDLLIDGVSFFRLPSKEMVERNESNIVPPSVGPSSITASELAESRAQSSDAGDLTDNDSVPDPGIPYEDLGLRLSLAGFDTGGAPRDPIDELHSDVYSAMVESLRTEITAHLPQSEALVSRAIIHAFFPDNDSETSPSDGSFSITERDAQQEEADALCNADEWAKLNLEYAPAPDIEDRVLSYFQKHVETLFSYVRNEELGPSDASRILLNVAAVLRLEFDKPFRSNTVVLQGLDRKIAIEDFLNILDAYGPVEAAGVAKTRCFAFCRFKESGALRRLKAAADHGRLFMGGERVYLTVLSEKVEKGRLGNLHDDLPAGVEASEGSTEEENFLASPGGDSVPHLMGAMSQDDMMFGSPGQLDPLVLNRCVSDGWVDTGLYDDMKIPQVSPNNVGSSFFAGST